MCTNARVLLPRALPVTRHVSGCRAAHSDRPRGVRGLGTSPTPALCRRNPEGHPAPANHTPSQGAVRKWAGGHARQHCGGNPAGRDRLCGTACHASAGHCAEAGDPAAMELICQRRCSRRPHPVVSPAQSVTLAPRNVGDAAKRGNSRGRRGIRTTAGQQRSRNRSSTRVPNFSASTGTRSSMPWNMPMKSSSGGRLSGENPKQRMPSRLNDFASVPPDMQ